MPKISLIASSVRCWLWDEFFKSLEGNSDYEVVFAGNLTQFQVRPYLDKYPMLKYIYTADCISPAQCYQIAYKFATGNLIFWACDDGEMSPNLLDNICEFHKILPYKSIISVKTKEDNLDTELDDHRFFGFNRETPLMAPLGIISREYLDQLGGFDKRFLAGQWENFTSCQVYADGGNVYKYEDGCVYIEHLKKHGRGTKFWKAYEGDRQVLEDAWAIGPRVEPPKADNNYGVHIQLNGFNPPTVTWPRWIDTRKVSNKSQTGFFPYTDENLTTVSQCPRKWPPNERI